MNTTTEPQPPKPYVGVSGVASRINVEQCLSRWHPNAQRELMLGVLTSRKTLYSQATRYPRRYPLIGDVREVHAELVGRSPAPEGVWCALHYSTETQDRFELRSELRLLRGHAQSYSALQLNAGWVHPSVVDFARRHMAFERIILQVKVSMDTAVRAVAERLALRLADYAQDITDVLYDCSCGTGTTFSDPRYAADLALATRARYPWLGVGIAGGLSRMHLPVVMNAEALAGLKLSFDAESRLRNEHDEFDLEVLEGYLARAAKMSGVERPWT